ncbi:MAG: DegV family protein [Clostridia bacterium]|nr:DegV family protein [Clostridia bacterium]MDY4082813.1 DegV family protein [Eubacteriales bacterium]
MQPFIFTDSTADIPSIRKYEDFDVLQLSYSLDDDQYDNITKSITPKEFYDRMRQGAKSATSMVNQVYALEKIEEVLKQGRDVIYLAFSSALSGTYNVGCQVVKELQPKYPDRKIAVIDTLNASLGEGLYVDYVVGKRDQGASFEEVVEYANSITDHVCSYFTVDDLKHLARMGRVSKTAAFIGELIQIKPVMYVNKLGELIPIAKVRTRKQVLKALVDKMEEKMLPADEQKVVYIGHGDSYDDAKYVADLITERFGITNIVIDYIGPVIGSHTNAGVIALFFLGKDKVEEKDARVSS